MQYTTIVPDVIPIFKSHYSLGRSILTLSPSGNPVSDAPVSIFDILLENKIDELFLVEDSFGGFRRADHGHPGKPSDR